MTQGQKSTIETRKKNPMETSINLKGSLPLKMEKALSIQIDM
jgi:hypothetical protein